MDAGALKLDLCVSKQRRTNNITHTNNNHAQLKQLMKSLVRSFLFEFLSDGPLRSSSLRCRRSLWLVLVLLVCTRSVSCVVSLVDRFPSAALTAEEEDGASPSGQPLAAHAPPRAAAC